MSRHHQCKETVTKISPCAFSTGDEIGGVSVVVMFSSQSLETFPVELFYMSFQVILLGKLFGTFGTFEA